MSNELAITAMEVNGDNLKRYQQAFEKNDMPMPLPKLQWQHDHYLKRSFISWIIDDKESIAGLYSSFFVDTMVEGKQRTAAQSIDTLTDINYRGKGLFTKLASDVNNRLAKDDTPFIYGFPNSNSAPGFFKKLGWKKIGDGSVPFLVRPIRLSFIFKRIFKVRSTNDIITEVNMPNKHIRKMNDFNDKQVNILSEFFLSTKKYAVSRNSNYLNWRFVEKPAEQYQIFGYYDNANLLKGLVVFTVKQKHGGNIGYIMELIYDTKDDSIGKKLLKYAIKTLKRSKADLVLAWSFKDAPNRRAFNKNLFYSIPEKFKTIKLFFGACLFDKNIKEESFFNAANWYISYCDSDTV